MKTIKVAEHVTDLLNKKIVHFDIVGGANKCFYVQFDDGQELLLDINTISTEYK